MLIPHSQTFRKDLRQALNSEGASHFAVIELRNGSRGESLLQKHAIICVRSSVSSDIKKMSFLIVR